MNMGQAPLRYLAVLLLANLSLLLPNASPLRVVGALLLIGFLPGLSWGHYFFTNSILVRWTIAAALSFTFTCLTSLLLHCLPGPIYMWQILAILNSLAILPLFINGRPNRRQVKLPDYSKLILTLTSPLSRSETLPLLLIMSLSLALRLMNLDYSEFQGDEALAMIAAAEALEGHEDAFLLRSKGPGELLLPMALWRLTGTINEFTARLPFTIASFLAIITIYLVGQTVAGRRVGWLAAGFFAFNGFMVAFGRIVQYQALVVWFSALAFFLALQWKTQRKTQPEASRQNRFAFLSGLFLGTALLAHYDAILVLPAIGWLFLSANPPASLNKGQLNITFVSTALRNLMRPAQIKGGGLFLAAFLSVSLLFYLPFVLDPQANRTGDYVGNRIGNELRNNLPEFFHFNTFYSSSYYLIITSLLILGLSSWIIWRVRWARWWGSLLLILSLAAIFQSHLFNLPEQPVDLTFLPFALALFLVFLALPFGSAQQAIVCWLAIPFLGYNFLVALGLTHIYTIVPAWSLLAAIGWYRFVDGFGRKLAPRWPVRLAYGFLSALLLLSTIFLWNSFVRHDVEYWQDYPAGNLWLYWTPYETPPEAGFFGFAHRTGWKAVGQKLFAGELVGDYGSNEEPDVTTWYTRGAPRACDLKPEFYLLADDLIDPVEAPAEIIAAEYVEIGLVTLSNQKQLRIMQQGPAYLKLGPLDEPRLTWEFDQTAIPAAFARSARGSQAVEANFGNFVQLIGYDLDTRRAEPGGRLPVTLYWQALTETPASYQVFTHLEGESGPAAQADGVPVCWTYPTDTWRPGQIIADQHAIPLPPDIPPGNYPLEVGLYLPDSFERLDLIDIAGNPAGTSLTLTTVEIRHQASQVNN